MTVIELTAVFAFAAVVGFGFGTVAGVRDAEKRTAAWPEPYRGRSDAQIEHEKLARGLAWMAEQGYSLVKVGDRWSFCRSQEPPADPPGDFPLVTSGNVLRSGFWKSPADAVLAMGRHHRA